MGTLTQQNDILGRSVQLHSHHNEPIDLFRKAFGDDRNV